MQMKRQVPNTRHQRITRYSSWGLGIGDSLVVSAWLLGIPKWLPNMDLNHDKQIQSLLCYRYTIRQSER